MHAFVNFISYLAIICHKCTETTVGFIISKAEVFILPDHVHQRRPLLFFKCMSIYVVVVVVGCSRFLSCDFVKKFYH